MWVTENRWPVTSFIPFKWACLWVDGAPGVDKLLTDWAVGTWGMEEGCAHRGHTECQDWTYLQTQTSALSHPLYCSLIRRDSDNSAGLETGLHDCWPAEHAYLRLQALCQHGVICQWRALGLSTCWCRCRIGMAAGSHPVLPPHPNQTSPVLSPHPSGSSHSTGCRVLRGQGHEPPGSLPLSGWQGNCGLNETEGSGKEATVQEGFWAGTPEETEKWMKALKTRHCPRVSQPWLNMRTAEGIFTKCWCLEPTYVIRTIDHKMGHQYFFEVFQVILGIFLVFQWLRFRPPKAEGLGSTPGQGTRSHMLQLRPSSTK